MKLKIEKNKILFVMLIGIGLVFSACHRDNNSTGQAYFPDMSYSYAFETYGSSPNFSDSIQMLMPVEGTIPREMIPYQFGKTFQEQVRAGQELVNPYTPDEAVMKRGKEQYTIFCSNCHGVSGKGDGYLVTSKLFTAQPVSLLSDYVQSKPDGEIFHVITLGSLSTLMGAHGSQIKPEDRWKIVTYVKNGLK
ncbi:MAG: c-type cytochrome [Bacteroidales bacterium]|nr:c-type cytochrome [Bacteroidales bacterium]